MIQKWKHIALWMVAATLGSCSTESYPGLVYEPQIPASLVNNESGRSIGMTLPITMAVNSSSFQMTSITRGSGPIDDVSSQDRFKNATFYVFAFRDNPDEKGVLAYTPSFKERSTDNNPDCLIDGNDYLLGMPARIDITTGLFHMKRANGVDTLLYYGSRHQDNGYNFFAYYLDDIPVNSNNGHRDEYGVYYDLELDGTQDLMTGHSLKMTEQSLTENYPIYSQLSKELQYHILNIGNYSAFSAYYDIHPVLYMRHLLTQLRFYAYPADVSAKDIEFTSIEVESVCEGRLYVVSVDVDNLNFTVNADATPKFLPLKELNTETGYYQALTPSKYKIEWDDAMDKDDWTKNKSVHIGGDMMLPTSATFHMKVAYKQKVHTLPERYREVVAEYLLKAPELDQSRDPEGNFCFLPSKSYAIKLGVFGGRTPDVVVDLYGWADGGDLDFPSDHSERE